MNKDSFKETLTRQYTEEMHEILVESEIDGHFNSFNFNEKLNNIWKSAKIDGITQEEFYDLVKHEVSIYMEDIIFPFELLKKAS